MEKQKCCHGVCFCNRVLPLEALMMHMCLLKVSDIPDRTDFKCVCMCEQDECLCVCYEEAENACECVHINLGSISCSWLQLSSSRKSHKLGSCWGQRSQLKKRWGEMRLTVWQNRSRRENSFETCQTLILWLHIIKYLLEFLLFLPSTQL